MLMSLENLSKKDRWCVIIWEENRYLSLILPFDFGAWGAGAAPGMNAVCITHQPSYTIIITIELHRINLT